MTTALEKVRQLQAELAAAELAASGEIAENKKKELASVLEHLSENKITLAELGAYARVAGSKYSNAAGDTWSGKGKKPAWVEKHLAAGGKLDDVLTVKPEPAATA